MPNLAAARTWLDRWDRQQERYVADREERFAVIADVVTAAAGRPDPLIVDLGTGPGSLALRLLQRRPSGRVVAVDVDPVLLGLNRAAHPEVPGLRIVAQDLRAQNWIAGLDLDRPVDAVVSTTALHWLTGPELGRLYADCATLLRPGGVLVNGDHLAEPGDRPRLRELTRVVRDGRAARAGVTANEDWSQWWDALAADPRLRDLVAARDVRPVDHNVPNPPGLAEHTALLRAAGFAEVGPVWQHGDDRVLVAVR